MFLCTQIMRSLEDHQMSPRNQDEENANQCGSMLVSHRKRVYTVCDLFDTEIFAYFLPLAHV